MLFDIRLPRIVVGIMVGALLSVAGAGYQGVFRNPLVDSGLLGASAGAGLGATLAIVYLGGRRDGRRPGRRLRRLAGRGHDRLPVRGARRRQLRHRHPAAGGRGGGPVPDRGADLYPAALGPGPAAGLLLAARLAVRRDLAAGRGDRPLRAGQRGGHAAARAAPGRAVGGRRGGPRARPAPGPGPAGRGRRLRAGRGQRGGRQRPDRLRRDRRPARGAPPGRAQLPPGAAAVAAGRRGLPGPGRHPGPDRGLARRAAHRRGHGAGRLAGVHLDPAHAPRAIRT